MIHVCYSLHDKDGHYSKFTGTSMLSLFENVTPPPSQVTIHLLHDNTLSQDNRDKLFSIAENYNQKIIFYNVEKTHADKIAEFYRLFPSIKTSKLSIGTLFRLLMTDIIPQEITKVIYLDSDTIINLNINEFWEIDLENKPLGVVPVMLNRKDLKEIVWDALSICRDGYVKWEDYFNAGILLMNLKKLRNEKKTIRKGIKFRESLGNHSSMDQCILNYCFSSRTKKLPVKFNRSVDTARQNGLKEIGNEIYHYVGSPLGGGILLNTQDNFNKLWLHYFMKTPFFNEDSIGRLYSGVQNIYVEQKAFATYVSAMMSGKTRAFYTVSQMSEGVKNIFGVRADEEIIFADESNSVGKMINLLRNSANKKVLFILVNNPQILQSAVNELLKNGFVENRDFINAFNFLSDAQGVPFNSYNLVKLM